MNPAEIAALLEERFQDRITGKNLEAIDPWVEVAPRAILDVAHFCKTDEGLAFDYLRDLEAVDWLVKDEKKAKKLAVEPHLELLYQLFSFKHRHNIVLKVKLERWKDGQQGKLPEVPSVSSVWRVADWHEREAYDLMGIRFIGHPNLRRILCAEDWEGHPLRKDYEFPLEYHGIRCR